MSSGATDSTPKRWAGEKPPYREVGSRETSIWRGGQEGDIYMRRWAGGRHLYEEAGRRETTIWNVGQEGDLHMKRWTARRHLYKKVEWEGGRPPYERVGRREASLRRGGQFWNSICRGGQESHLCNEDWDHYMNCGISFSYPNISKNPRVLCFATFSII